MYLPVCLCGLVLKTVCLSVRRSICLFALYLFVWLFDCPSVCLSCLCLPVFACVSVGQLVCMSFLLYVGSPCELPAWMFSYRLVFLYFWLACLIVYTSVKICLLACLLACLSACVCVCVCVFVCVCMRAYLHEFARVFSGLMFVTFVCSDCVSVRLSVGLCVCMSLDSQLKSFLSARVCLL